MIEGLGGQRWRLPVGAYPWLGLFGGIGVASDGRKLLLAVLGLALMWAGWAGLDRAFPDSREISPLVPTRMPLGEVRLAPSPLREAAAVLTDPLLLPTEPFRGLLVLGGGNRRFAHGLLAGLWAVGVWSVAGGAIARVTVAELVAGRRLGLVPALGFALRKSGPLLLAPLGPLGGAAFLAAVLAGLGLLYRLPGPAGPTIAGAVGIVSLLAGLGMAFFVALAAAAWPLIVASVAVEAEDTFDALSRGTSYVLNRPVAYALQAGLAWIIGAIGLLIAALAARLVLGLTAWGLAVGGPDAVIGRYFGPPGAEPATMAAGLHSGWIALVTLLAYGWAYAYFWSSAAHVGLILRRDVDGASLEDVLRKLNAGDLSVVTAEPTP